MKRVKVRPEFALPFAFKKAALLPDDDQRAIAAMTEIYMTVTGSLRRELGDVLSAFILFAFNTWQAQHYGRDKSIELAAKSMHRWMNAVTKRKLTKDEQETIANVLAEIQGCAPKKRAKKRTP